MSETHKKIAIIIGIMLIFIIGYAVPIAGAISAIDTLRETVGNMLPNYYDADVHHDLTTVEPGPQSIGSAILYVTDFMKYIIGGIAIIYLFISAIRLITAGEQIEEVITKEKQNFTYIVIGLLVMILSTGIINDVLSQTGEIDFIESKTFAEDAAIEASKHIRGLYNFIQAFIGAIAILVIVIAGFRIMTGAGSEDVLSTQKKHIVWASVGLIVIGISEFVVKEIIFEDYGSKIDFSAGVYIISRLTNFLASFISFFAILALIYAGFLYVTSRGEEEQTGKAKKILWGVVIAIIITLAAYSLINTFLGLNYE